MAGDVIADAIVRIGADTSPAEREVAKFQHEFDARMAAMDRQRATAQIDLDSKAFDREEAEIRARMKVLNNLDAHPEVNLDADAAKKEIGQLKRALSELDQRKTSLKISSDDAKAANAALAELTKREQARAALAEKSAAARRRHGLIEAKAHADNIALTERQGRIEAAAHAANDKRIRDRSVMESKAWAERSKRMQSQLQLESRARRENAAFDSEQAEANLRRIAELDKLRIAYAKALSQKQYYEKKTGRPGGMFRSDAETRALKAASSEVELLRHRIVSLDGSVTDINPNLESHQGLLGRWASSLSSVRLQLGFFSATLRQLGIGVVALGPIFSGLLGAATSLVGVLGTGLAGALSVGSAAFGGFMASALGVGLVLKPAIDDFSAAAKASDALADAQLKYGRGSEQAATAQEKLNQTLKGIDPTARSAVRSWGQMKNQWANLTKETRKPIFDAMASSITTAKALLPSYAAQTVATTKVVGAAWERGMRALRGEEAKRGLNELMANFRSAIPAFTSGFGSLSAMMGRVSVSASKLLPSLGEGFADWAQGIEDAVGSGDALDTKIGRIVNHMRSVGRFAQSAGSLLVNMFNSSADAGDGLLVSMTETFDTWNAWVKSAGGQDSLAKFFDEAANEARLFASAVSNLTHLLWAVARAGAPISDVLFTALNMVGDLVTAFAPLRTILGGAAWVGFASLVVRQLAKITGALGAARGAMMAFSAASAGGALSGMFGGLGRNSSKIRATTVATQGLATGMGAVAVRGGLMAAAMSPATLVPVAAIAALALFIGKMEEAKTAWEEASEASRAHKDDVTDAVQSVMRSSDKLVGAYEQQTSAQKEVKESRDVLAKLQEDGAPAAKQVAALQRMTQAERSYAAASAATSAGHRRSIKATRELKQGAEARMRTAEREIRVGRRTEREGVRAGEMLGEGYNPARAELGAKRAAHGVAELAAAQREAAAASVALAAAMVPTERRLDGLKPISDQAQAGLEKLSTTIGAAATKKIGNFVDPKAVQQITSLGNRLTTFGRGTQVKNIAVKSQGAEETTAKLQRLQRQTTKVEGARANIKVGANDQQAQTKLKRLGALSQRLTGGQNTIRIMANAASAEAAIANLRQSLRATVSKQYKAEISAADKTGPGYNSAKHRMRDIANTRAEINIRAIDNATNPARGAKRAVDSVKDKKVSVAVTGAAAAAGQAASVAAALAKIESKTVSVHVNYSSSGSTKEGRYEGGRAHYVQAMAGGGDARQKMLDRAAEQAVVRPGGRSQKITRPTMLTGEEAPRYPEYVIAANPAYRAANERYLGAAANDLGYEVVPSYAKGKMGLGKKQKAKGGGQSGGNQGGGQNEAARIQQLLANGPKASASGSGKRPEVPPRLLNKTPIVNTQNEVDALERAFERMKDHETREIAAGRKDRWSFAWYKQNQYDERKARNQLKGTLTTNGLREITQSLGATSKWLKGPGSSAKFQAARKRVTQAEKGKNSDAKRAARRDLQALEKQRDRAGELIREGKEARAEMKRIKGEQGEPLSVLQDDLQEINDIEAGRIDAPYSGPEGPETFSPTQWAEKVLADAEIGGNTEAIQSAKQGMIAAAEQELATARTTASPVDDVEAARALQSAKEALTGSGPGAGGAPSLAEQTASFNTAREDLYRQFASNVTGTPTNLPYTPGGGVFAGGPTTAGSPAGGAGPGKVVNVTNNFAAPPPDPHTWTAQQSFELGNL